MEDYVGAGAFDEFIGYYIDLRGMMSDYLSGDVNRQVFQSDYDFEPYELLGAKFAHLSDPGMAIQDAFSEYGEEDVKDSFRGSEDNEILIDYFEDAERYLNALGHNLEDMLEIHDVPESEAEHLVGEFNEYLGSTYGQVRSKE